MNRLHRTAILGSCLALLSCQEQSPTASANPSGPVAFRFQAPGASVLPIADVVAVRAWLDDTVLLIDKRFAWSDGAAELTVPLNRALRFEVQGIRRRLDRDLTLWTATGRDTLEGLSSSRNVVAMQTTIADTSAPDILRSTTGQGGSLVVLDSVAGTLGLRVAPGAPSGSLVLPAPAGDSLYLDGAPVAAVDGNWTLELDLGSTATLVLVGANRAAVRWSVEVSSGDDTPLSFAISASPGAVREERGDTLVFTLPYVVDSAPRVRIALADPKDRPSQLAFGSDSLDRSRADWIVSMPVPVAGNGGELLRLLVARDSVGNATRIPVKIGRSAVGRSPQLSWSTPPRDEPWGVRETRIVLRVVGGDSLLTPLFATSGLATASAARLSAPASGDTTWWEATIPLQERDSGSVTVEVTNKMGLTWMLPPARIRRFDPAGPDRTAPVLSVTSPSGTGWTRSGDVSVISGRAFDERGGKVSVLVTRPGRTDSVATVVSDSSWSWILAWAGDGDTTLAVSARDQAGNTSAPVQVRLVRDTRKPGFVLATTPALRGDTLRTTTNEQVFSVTSTATDLRRLWALRTGTDDTLPFLATAPGSWEATLSFATGSSTWVVGATDSAGNDSLRIVRVLVVPVMIPVQKSGIAPGATGREFLATFACPDSGAVLEASASGGGWLASTGNVFVGADTSVTLRCRVSPSTSNTLLVSWSSKDTSEALPEGLAGIPDSAWALGASRDGSLWVVTSHDSAWVRPRGDALWRSVASPFSSRGAVDLVDGDPATGARWFQAWSGTSLALASTSGTSLSLQATLTLQREITGRPVSALGTNSIGVAYLSNTNGTLELRRLSNLAAPIVFPTVGAPLSSVSGIVETATDTYLAVAGAFGAPYTLGVSILQVPGQTITQATLLKAAYSPSFLRKLPDGSLILGTQDGIAIVNGVRYVGRLYRFPAGTSVYEPADSAVFESSVLAGAATPSGDRIWLGLANSPTAPVASLSGTDFSTATDLPPLTVTSYRRKIATTAIGTAWVAMQADADSRPRLYRYHRR